MACGASIRIRFRYCPRTQERLDAVRAEFDALSAQYESAEELPDVVDAKFGELEAEIERLTERQ